jgi:pilus assembly protein CpaF
VRDESANGTLIGDEHVIGEARVVDWDCVLGVGPYRIRLRPGPSPVVASAQTVVAVPAAQVEQAHARLLALPTRRRIRSLLLDHLDLAQLDRDAMQEASLRPKVRKALETICTQLAALVPSDARAALIDELCDEALGLGPLERLLCDDEVSEIMVVDPTHIFAERGGRIELTALCFTDEDSIRAVIERIVTPMGRRIDESNPLVDARLQDGSRVNAVIRPLANKGPCITIRKFAAKQITFERLLQLGSLDTRMLRFLQRAVRCRRNIVVAGGTGSGKTTLLNVLSSAIDAHERVVTIEDAAELRLQQAHVVSLESRPSNLEGRGEITIRDLVRNALRMRPDRIIVGECRGGEAIDMLQAMNTGHEGSMTTLHANTPAESIARLETLCLMSGLELPLRAVRAQIASSIHLIVQQSRFEDGSRRVSHITEVRGLADSGELVLEDIFRFERASASQHAGVVGEFRATGYLPGCIAQFVERGLVTDGVYL